jgi:FKBP-type peptidyl-prolyl cis-trans isomerase
MVTTVTPPTTQTAAVTPTPTTTPVVPTTSKGIISTSTIDGMKIEVIKEGTGPAITNGQTAVMLYTGKLADGTVFDSTANHGNQPFTFALGAGQVIKGWDEGIVGMKVGEERTLIIPAALGYGAAGYPPVIPANATLTFDVTLVGIQ